MGIPLREVPVCIGLAHVHNLWQIHLERFEKKEVAKEEYVELIL